MTALLSPPSAPRVHDAGAGVPGGAGSDGGGPRGRGPRHAVRRSHSGRRRLGRVGRSRLARFGLPLLAVLTALVAAAALAFPVLSGWYSSTKQHELSAELDDPTLAGQISNGTVGDGKPIGRVVIPAIHLDMVVVQGVDTSALEEGPGHYPATSMPCTGGDSAVAGHRTTFLHPFYNLNELQLGDLIEFETPAFSCAYRVSEPPFAVLPNDVAVVDNTPGQYTLTLTTCTPRGSASHRLVVKAAMVPSSLKEPAASPGTSKPTGAFRGVSSRKVG